jgi:hypothetical protein
MHSFHVYLVVKFWRNLRTGDTRPGSEVDYDIGRCDLYRFCKGRRIRDVTANLSDTG